MSRLRAQGEAYLPPLRPVRLLRAAAVEIPKEYPAGPRYRHCRLPPRSPAHSRRRPFIRVFSSVLLFCVNLLSFTRPPAVGRRTWRSVSRTAQMFDDERPGQYAPADIGRTAGCAFRGGVFDTSVEHQQLQLNSGQSPHTASVAESVVRKEQGERLTQERCTDAESRSYGCTAGWKAKYPNAVVRS